LSDAAGRISRRAALGMIAGATVTTIGGCSSSPPTTPRPRRHEAPTTPPSPHPSNPTPAVTGPHARALQRKLDGTVYRPGQQGYDAARLLFDRRFDGIAPALVARVASEADVAHCLDFAKHYSLPITVRSGGHSYIGASVGRGVVIDLRGLNGITFDAASGRAVVGAGAALVDVYSRLAANGVGIPAGSCPTVGVSGLTLGGGIGVVSRQRGLTCDSLTAARIVTADGTVVTADAHHHNDLLWALRGGGGSFGVVTTLTFDTFPVGTLSHAFLKWPWSAAIEVVAAWQTWAPAAPPYLWSACHVLATEDKSAPPILSVAAVSSRSTGDLQQHLGALTQLVPAAATTNFVTSESWAATMLLEAGCSQLSVQQCHVGDETAGGALPRDAFVAGSDFFADQIPRAGITALVKAVKHRQADPRLGAGGASFDILGGAIDSVAEAATAWAHRGALFGAQYTASWGEAHTNRPLARNQHSLAAIHNTIRRYARGDAYQNYADDTLADAQQAYYGANLAKLIDVRRTYDPSGTFTQPQGVPLS